MTARVTKVVFDTNILVSGHFWKGPPHRCLLAVDAGLVLLVLSEPILSEFKGRVERAVQPVRDDCYAGEVLTDLAAARARGEYWCRAEYGLRRHRRTLGMRDYHQLDIWDRAMAYAVQVYAFTAQLPDTERYNLAAQLRRAATSVPLNIDEGSGCTTAAEFARFVGYAYRSLKEVVTGLELCQLLYPSLPGPPATALSDEGNQISRMAYSLIQRLGTSTEPRAW